MLVHSRRSRPLLCYPLVTPLDLDPGIKTLENGHKRAADKGLRVPTFLPPVLMSLVVLAAGLTRAIRRMAHECLDSMPGQVEGNRMVAV